MLLEYRECAPGGAIAKHVQCVWTLHACSGASHRVYPDGCVDILYARDSGRSSLRVIGAMTEYADVAVPAGYTVIAARFRPGMLSGWCSPTCGQFTDQAVDLAAVSGFAARRLKQVLDDTESLQPERFAQVLKDMLGLPPPPNPAQQAIAYLEEHHGMVDLAWLAEQTNLGERQFRRVCRSLTGLSPKLLARTLRFQRALALIRSGGRGPLTAIALECGYYDQAHFIHDLRAWTGRNPTELLK